MTISFTWIDAERLVRFGPGALEEAPRLLAERGFEGYALLTTARARTSATAIVRGAAVVLDVPGGGVPEAAAYVRRQAGSRPLVALGGGRVIDSAKAVAACDDLSCAAIPTTLSGAPMTPFHRLPEGGEARRMVRPSLVVVEPRLAASQPMPFLAASAMNALAHAVESLYTPLANPVAEQAALRAAGLIARALGADAPQREDLALAAVLAGYAVGSAGLAFHHALCQTIVRVAGSPHAETNAVMLPHSVRFATPRAPEAIGLLADALESGDAAAAVAALAARASATTLSQLGVRQDQFEAVTAEIAGHRGLHMTPGGAPSEEDLRGMLTAAF